MLIREPNGSVQLVAPVYGLPTVPSPLPPVQLGGVTAAPCTNSSCNVPKMLPELVSPPAAWTVSTRLSTVSVSCASSVKFRIEYEQLYGSPIFTGLTQPFVSVIPCCTAARAPPAAIIVATTVAAATAVNTAKRFMSFLPVAPSETTTTRPPPQEVPQQCRRSLLCRSLGRFTPITRARTKITSAKNEEGRLAPALLGCPPLVRQSVTAGASGSAFRSPRRRCRCSGSGSRSEEH